MKQIRLSLLIIAAVFCLSSCRKNEVVPMDLGYDYFPTIELSYIIYNVDSIYYGVIYDTVHFQLKELVAYQFTDGEGDPAYAIERYKRINENEPWLLTDVWSQKRTTSTSERVEEDVRYIRLAFPVENGKTWNGNAYNTIGNWQYSISNVDEVSTLGLLQFSKTLRVNQRNNVNLIDQEIAFEKYAKGVGLIYKRFTDINTQPGQISGVHYEWKAIAYGNE